MALATPKSITFGTGAAVVERDQNVAGLDVPVNDALLMRMLHGLADGDEELQSLAGRQMLLVAELRDRNAMDEFHHEVRPATVGRARIEHLGDVGVVHQRQGLAFGLEPGDHLPRVHPRLDDLQGHASLRPALVCSAM